MDDSTPVQKTSLSDVICIHGTTRPGCEACEMLAHRQRDERDTEAPDEAFRLTVPAGLSLEEAYKALYQEHQQLLMESSLLMKAATELRDAYLELRKGASQ